MRPRGRATALQRGLHAQTRFSHRRGGGPRRRAARPRRSAQAVPGRPLAADGAIAPNSSPGWPRTAARMRAFLGPRFDRYKELLSFNDLWTPRREARLPDDAARGIRAARRPRAAPMSAIISTSASASRSRRPASSGRMTSALVVRPGDKVLEIGTGSGYQSALLSYLTSRLWSIEIIPELAARTRGVYDALIGKGYREYAIITTRSGDGYYGWEDGGAVRQDHRHLRHRPYPAAAAAAIEAERHHGHSGRAAGRAAYPQGGQDDRAPTARPRWRGRTFSAARSFPSCRCRAAISLTPVDSRALPRRRSFHFGAKT